MGEEARSVRTLSLATGTVVGFLFTASALILLDHLNIELAAVWRDLFVAPTAQIKSALAFWIIAATARRTSDFVPEADFVHEADFVPEA